MNMHTRLAALLHANAFVLGEDGIYAPPQAGFAAEQLKERNLRERVAGQQYDDYFTPIARSHSIPVMDYEVDRFLKRMPPGALILDIGGCWGWHWRRLAATRPDIGVLVIDFVRTNLGHARKLLGPLVGTSVALMHADAMALPFPDGGIGWVGFDGVWTVQVFQHIPDFRHVCGEAYRVLRPGGRFTNHSLHITPFNRMLYRLLGQQYHCDGMRNNQFHLTRANDKQRQILDDLFEGGEDRYTECLFHPDLKWHWTGGRKNLVGAVDARLGNFPWLGKWIARQRGFEGRKA